MAKASFGVLIGLMALIAPGVEAAAKAPPAPPAAVSGPAGIGKGDVEFGVFANYTTFDDIDADTVILGATVGSFLSDSFELRITPVINYTSGGGMASYGISPFVSGEFLFRGASRAAPVVPFIGGGIGLMLQFTEVAATTGDVFTYGLFVGPTGGLKYFVTERASLELALTYQLGVIESCDSYDCYSGDMNTLQQALRFNIYY